MGYPRGGVMSTVAAPVPVGSGDEVVELSRLRTRIAGHMVNAKRTAAHCP